MVKAAAASVIEPPRLLPRHWSPALSDPAGSSPSGDSVKTFSRPPEEPLLARVRTWTDVMPWLRLVRVARLAGAPVWLFLVAMVDLVWRLGLNWLTVTFADAPEAASGRTQALLIQESMPKVDPWQTSTTLSDLVWWLSGRGPSFSLPWQSFSFSMMPPEVLLWTVVLWTPVVMVLLRLGVLLTAGRDLPGFVETWKIVGQRLKSAVVISVLPGVCALPFVLFLWLGDGLATGERKHWEWAYALAPLAIPAALIVGLLMAGAKAAIPFGLAALVSQEKADAMDCLSRGYEVTFRRLPQLFLLLVPAGVLVGILSFAWSWVAEAASSSMGNPVWQAFLARVPILVGVTVGWAMVGGVYLLLRQFAGGQEVEDVWDGPKRAPLNVPSVKRDA